MVMPAAATISSSECQPAAYMALVMLVRCKQALTGSCGCGSRPPLSACAHHLI